MVFDVESIGLHGHGFAAGYVLMEGEDLVDMGWAACSPYGAGGTEDGRDWVLSNCPWSTKPETFTDPPPAAVFTCSEELQDWFWERWIRETSCELWADVPWPVEARFLIEAVGRGEPAEGWLRGEGPTARETAGSPYPLFDVRSVVEAVLMLPDGDRYREKIEGVKPAHKHHPLYDAMCSASQLALCERILRGEAA